MNTSNLEGKIIVIDGIKFELVPHYSEGCESGCCQSIEGYMLYPVADK